MDSRAFLFAALLFSCCTLSSRGQAPVLSYACIESRLGVVQMSRERLLGFGAFVAALFAVRVGRLVWGEGTLLARAFFSLGFHWWLLHSRRDRPQCR